MKDRSSSFEQKKNILAPYKNYLSQLYDESAEAISIEDTNQKAAEKFYYDVMKNVKIEEKPAVPSTIEAGEVTLVEDEN